MGGGMKSGELPIKTEGDLVTCRKAIRTLATSAGFGMTDVTRIVTSVSELARNIYVHAGSDGVMHWQIHNQSGKVGLELIFKDQGVGIANVEQALQAGFSTSNNSLGMGLSGVKRLMDEMDIVSELGVGTTVTIVKWARVK
jgi:serine/threonine-protein kinase RsbT